MTHTLVPASVLPGLLKVALGNRIDAQAFFEAAGVDPDAIGRSDRFIDLAQVDPVLEAAFCMGDDPCFGLVAGRGLGHTRLDVPGRLLATANTLHDALETLLRYKSLLVPYLEFTLSLGSVRARIDIMPDPRLRFAHSRPHTELTMAAMVALARSLVGDEFPLRCAGFTHSRPASLSLYEEIFGDALEFECESNRLEVDLSVLEKPLPTADPGHHHRLRRLADQMLVGVTRAQSTGGQVQALLEQRLGTGDTSIEAVAAALEMTPRTLQRRLSQESITFVGLRDEVRHRRACEMLAEDVLDMSAIASSLGFSDTANFYHAFRRWEGCAPGEYRRIHRQR